MNKKEIKKDNRLQIRIESEKLEALKKHAEENDITLSDLVNRYIEQGFQPETAENREKEKAVEID